MSKYKVLLVAALAAGLLAGCSGTETVSSKGRIVTVDAEEGLLMLNHEEIPGLMMGMTMPFPVKDKALLEGFAAGDAVEFDVENSSQGLMVVGLRKIDPSELSLDQASFEGRARVIAVNNAAGAIAIRAEDIPGIPPDGDLVYSVSPPTLMAGIADGDTVEITIQDMGMGQMVVTALKKVE